MGIKSQTTKAKPSDTAFKLIKVQLKHIDLLVEVLDARVPDSSRHPNSIEIFGAKPRIIVLAKSDLADTETSTAWINWFKREHSETAVLLNLTNATGANKLINLILKHAKQLNDKLKHKGLLPRPIRVCILGLPNVGKSTLINRLIGQRKLKVANRPGVTKGPQWVRVHPEIELLDTPGILPRAKLDKQTTNKLALLNLCSLTQEQEIEDLANYALNILIQNHPHIAELHALGDPASTFTKLAEKRNFITRGGGLDLRRTAHTFVNELRSGKLGKITLDKLPDAQTV